MIDELTMGDAVAAAGLSARFGWPHRVEDWRFFLRLGQGVAWREEGVLMGTAMWFALDEGHASIGLVQVAPELRGRGVGRRLMGAVMARAGGRSLVLHATAEGAGLYASLGFTVQGEVEQWQGEFVGEARMADGVRMAEPGDWAAIGRMDELATGLARGEILDAVMVQASVVIAEGGYAVRRSFGRGALIGPVVAADEGAAIAMMESLGGPGFLRLDVPAEHESVIASLAAQDLTCVGRVVRMTTGAWPIPVGPARPLALISQALG